jgi:hypothetical protein
VPKLGPIEGDNQMRKLVVIFALVSMMVLPWAGIASADTVRLEGNLLHPTPAQR